MTTANLQPTRLAKTRTPVRACAVAGGELLAAVRAERLARRVEAVRAAAGHDVSGERRDKDGRWTREEEEKREADNAEKEWDDFFQKRYANKTWKATNAGDTVKLVSKVNYSGMSASRYITFFGIDKNGDDTGNYKVRISDHKDVSSKSGKHGENDKDIVIERMSGRERSGDRLRPEKLDDDDGADYLEHDAISSIAKLEMWDANLEEIKSSTDNSVSATEHIQADADSKTVVKVILQDDKGRVLILKDSGSQWDDLPGGHVQQGEDPVQGLIREVYEETGIRLEASEVKLYREQAIPKPHGGRMLLYKAKADPQRVKLSEEHSGAAWVKRGQLGQRNLGRYAKDVEEASQEASGAAHSEARAKAQAEHKRAALMALGLAAHAVADGQTAHPDGKAKVVGGMLAFMALGAAAAYLAAHRELADGEGVPQELELPQADGHAQSRTELLKPAAEDAVAELEAEKVAVEREQVARGAVVENEISKRLAKKARELEGARWERIADTEATATYGASALRVLDLAGFATVKWSQLDRPTKRHTHAKNQEQGEQPLGFVYPASNQAYPGDPAGGVENCVNCLCQLIGVRRKELSK